MVKFNKMKAIHDLLFMINRNYVNILHGFLDISQKLNQYVITQKFICIK